MLESNTKYNILISKTKWGGMIYKIDNRAF